MGGDGQTKISSIVKPAVTLLICIVIVLIMLKLFVRFIENKLLFYPVSQVTENPGDYGTPYESVTFSADDGTKLEGWYAGEDSPESVVFFLHGNAGNLGHRAHFISLARRAGMNMFAFDYRGFGNSEGKPTERGIYSDGRGAYDYLRERFPDASIQVWGRSVGAVAAVRTVLDRGGKRLVLESCFTSKEDVIKNNPVMRFLNMFSSLELRPVDRVGEIDIPVLVVHGDRDGIVPYRLGLGIYRALKAPKELYTVKGAGHNDTYITGGREYFERIKSFLES